MGVSESDGAESDILCRGDRTNSEELPIAADGEPLLDVGNAMGKMVRIRQVCLVLC